MRTSGRDIYVTAGDNFYLTIAIKDEWGEKIPMIPEQDFADMSIRINNQITTIQGRIINEEFSFYIPSDLGRISDTQNYHVGTFHYDIKRKVVYPGNVEPDLITTIVPKSLFVIEETIGQMNLNSYVIDDKGKNPEEEV